MEVLFYLHFSPHLPEPLTQLSSGHVSVERDGVRNEDPTAGWLCTLLLPWLSEIREEQANLRALTHTSSASNTPACRGEALKMCTTWDWDQSGKEPLSSLPHPFACLLQPGRCWRLNQRAGSSALAWSDGIFKSWHCCDETFACHHVHGHLPQSHSPSASTLYSASY